MRRQEVGNRPKVVGLLLAPRTYSGYVPVGEVDGRKMYEHYLFFDPWLMGGLMSGHWLRGKMT